MRFTRRLSRSQRYFASSVIAFATHWSLAFALPTTARVNSQAKPALVWLEAAPSAKVVGTGAPEQDAASGQTLLTRAPASVRARLTRRRDVSRVAMPSESLKAESSPVAQETMTRSGQLELAGRMPEARDAGAADTSITGHTANAPGGEHGVALGGSAGMPGSGAAGENSFVHGPLLRAATGCAGYFPSTALAGHGEVEIDVTVDAGGHARASHVLNEQPWGQGFGVAARGCVRTLSFAPAVDRSGAAVSGHAKLRLRFDRPFTT